MGPVQGRCGTAAWRHCSAIQCLQRVANDLQPAVCDLWPVFCDLRRATCNLRPAISVLRPVACDLRPATCNLRPVTWYLRPVLCLPPASVACNLRPVACVLRHAICDLPRSTCDCTMQPATVTCDLRHATCDTVSCESAYKSKATTIEIVSIISRKAWLGIRMQGTATTRKMGFGKEIHQTCQLHRVRHMP